VLELTPHALRTLSDPDLLQLFRAQEEPALVALLQAEILRRMDTLLLVDRVQKHARQRLMNIVNFSLDRGDSRERMLYLMQTQPLNFRED
jgi:hypothetical protein